MAQTKIYTLNCTHVIGTLGPDTFEVKQPKCKTCNRTLVEEIKYSQVEYLFDEYNNEDMFSGLGALIITEELYNNLYKNGIKGFVPIKVTVGKSRYFQGNLKDLPRFFHLGIMPPEVENIPIAYTFAGVCPTCHRNIMDSDTFDPDLIQRESLKNKTPLQVISKTWNNNDVFNFVDHGETGITEAFLKIIEQFNCPDNIIIPAKWI